MYIREHVTINKKTGKKYIKHSLVESYRIDGKVRQNVIMNLGTLDLSKEERRMLAAALEARLSGQTSLFEENEKIASAAQKAMQHYDYKNIQAREREFCAKDQVFERIDLNSVNTIQNRQLGPELVGHTFWQRLGFKDILKNCGFSPYQVSLAEAVIVRKIG